MFRIIKHKRYVGSYLFKIKFKTINITLTASRKGGLTDGDVKKIDNNAMLIRKYERRMKLLKY